jgi:hypothetical protein
VSKALVTMFAGTHEAFRPATLPMLRRFADRYGYELLEATPVDEDLHPAWSKLPALSAALERHDVVLWVDADVFVLDHTEDPADALVPGVAFAVLHDVRYGMCSALFALRSCALARRLLADAWALRHGDYPDWDQGALRAVVAADVALASVTVLLGADWFEEGSGERLIHACRQGGSVPERVASLRCEVAGRAQSPAAQRMISGDHPHQGRQPAPDTVQCDRYFRRSCRVLRAPEGESPSGDSPQGVRPQRTGGAQGDGQPDRLRRTAVAPEGEPVKVGCRPTRRAPLPRLPAAERSADRHRRGSALGAHEAQRDGADPPAHA